MDTPEPKEPLYEVRGAICRECLSPDEYIVNDKVVGMTMRWNEDWTHSELFMSCRYCMKNDLNQSSTIIMNKLYPKRRV